MRARKPLVVVAVVMCQVAASMGPRPCGRGNGLTETQATQLSGSFNGAAPLRARKPPRALRPRCRRRSFNGAAPLRARKPSPKKRSGRCRRLGFNGAAPLRARKLSVPLVLFYALPGFNGAAPLRARKLRTRRPGDRIGASASMGPRPCGRGNRCAAADCPAPHVLQWGRALAGAETGQAVRVLQAYGRRLQWGRALAGAETPGARIRRRAALRRLQWGRALAGAETGMSIYSGPRDTQ